MINVYERRNGRTVTKLWYWWTPHGVAISYQYFFETGKKSMIETLKVRP